MDAGSEGLEAPKRRMPSLKLGIWTLGICAAVVLASSALCSARVISEPVDGFVRVMAYLVVSAYLLVIARRSNIDSKLCKTVLLLIAVGFVPRLLGWTEDIPMLDGIPLLGHNGVFHESTVVAFGMFWIVLPFGLFYRWITSADAMQVALQASVHERTLALQDSNQRLSQEMCDRLRVENELDQARRNLEAVAASRSDQLREAQSQLVRQERLSALGKMATGIAHELNNTLSPVVAFSEFLKDATNLTQQQREWVGYIAQGATDAADVIRGLRKFHGNYAEEKREVIELVPLVEQVVEMTRPVWRDAASADGKRIQLYLDVEAEPKTLANSVELRQVLINLIINASESIAQEGLISIRIGCDKDAVIEVRDTGVGMSLPEIERCFEPFYTSKASGTGLGLSVCHGIVRDHGGTLSVESKSGEGSSFRIELPLVRDVKLEKASESEAAFEWESAKRRMTCLYVDDNDMLLRTFSSICDANNVDVTLASSAEEALTILENSEFDLVITDLSMGEMDGVELIQLIRARGIETPIVLLTGWLESKVKQRLLGMVKPDYIMQKPATATDYLIVFRQFAPALSETSEASSTAILPVTNAGRRV